MKTLNELFIDELSAIYDAEQQLTKALPEMAKQAHHDDLRDAFEAHYEETVEHVKKVAEIFEVLGKTPRARKCPAMESLIQEASETASKNEDSPTLDAALIASAQKVEHYEIATYGCLCEWAKQLNNAEAMELLTEILEEEAATDEILTVLACECCNEEAELESDDTEEPAQERTADRQ